MERIGTGFAVSHVNPQKRNRLQSQLDFARTVWTICLVGQTAKILSAMCGLLESLFAYSKHGRLAFERVSIGEAGEWGGYGRKVKS